MMFLNQVYKHDEEKQHMGCIDEGAGNGKNHYTCMITLIQSLK